MVYDSQNIFAKILRGEIPCRRILESPWGLAFHDINPQAPLHALIIPGGPYTCSEDFYKRASAQEIVGFYRFVGEVIDHLDVRDQGYRLLSNCGLNGGQEVPHFHLHLFAGRPLGPMLTRAL